MSDSAMSDMPFDRVIRVETEKLVDAISHRWSSDMMKEITNDMEYGQYSEAVLDIVATSFKNESYLKKSEINMIKLLVHKMGIETDLRKVINYLMNNIKNNDEVQSNLATLAM